ncbi:hypothetical protein K1719_000578 [Acacia pycnantha]|nr:hypothetical protein K1719_000578 [Acacia pycnantha]
MASWPSMAFLLFNIGVVPLLSIVLIAFAFLVANMVYVFQQCLKMKEPQYLSGIPEPTAKGRKRSAKEAGKSKVGEFSGKAEPKKLKVGSRPSPEPKSAPSLLSEPPCPKSPLPKSTDAEPSPCLIPSYPLVLPPSFLRSHLWSKGITEELNTLPLPARYQEPSLAGSRRTRSPALGNAFLKGAGLTQSFLTPHHKYAEAREVQLEKVEFRLKETEGLLADSNVIIEGFKAAQARSEEQLKAMTAERDGFRAEVDRIKAEGRRPQHICPRR